jgi:ABC-type maltose transport system permease subunit
MTTWTPWCSSKLAAAFLSAIPVFLVFMGLQRWIVSGSTAGAVKG